MLDPSHLNLVSSRANHLSRFSANPLPIVGLTEDFVNAGRAYRVGRQEEREAPARRRSWTSSPPRYRRHFYSQKGFRRHVCSVLKVRLQEDPGYGQAAQEEEEE